MKDTPEITDEDLAALRSNFGDRFPLVQSLVARIDRVERERDTMQKALKWIVEEANTGESGDAYVMKEEAFQTLAALQNIRRTCGNSD